MRKPCNGFPVRSRVRARVRARLRARLRARVHSPVPANVRSFTVVRPAAPPFFPPRAAPLPPVPRAAPS